jgi:hypothetical protein
MEVTGGNRGETDMEETGGNRRDGDMAVTSGIREVKLISSDL